MRPDSTAAAVPLPGIDRLLLVLTNRCNLSCTYCFQTAPGELRMPWDALRAGIGSALKEAAPRLEIIFSGGEPLLEFEHVRKGVSHIKELSPPQTRIRYWLSTNGLLLTNEIADYLQEHKINVQLSFDGVAAAQDYRGTQTFEILDRLVDRLKTEHPVLFAHWLSIAMTVIPPTVRHLADSVEYFIGKGISRLSIAPSTTYYPGWEGGSIDELDAQFARISDLCRRHLARTGEVPVKLFRKTRGETRPKDRLPRACRGLSGSALVIDANGQACGCPFFADSCRRFPSGSLTDRLKSLRFGDIGDPGFSERRAAALDAARRLAPPGWVARCHSSYGACRACEYRAECFLCPVSIWSVPENKDPLRVPDFICAFNRTAARHRERFPHRPGLLDTFSRQSTV